MGLTSARSVGSEQLCDSVLAPHSGSRKGLGLFPAGTYYRREMCKVADVFELCNLLSGNFPLRQLSVLLSRCGQTCERFRCCDGSSMAQDFDRAAPYDHGDAVDHVRFGKQSTLSNIQASPVGAHSCWSGEMTSRDKAFMGKHVQPCPSRARQEQAGRCLLQGALCTHTQG